MAWELLMEGETVCGAGSVAPFAPMGGSLHYNQTKEGSAIDLMGKSNAFLFIVPLLLLLPGGSEAQEKSRPYLNVGYVTSLSKCEECDKTDNGGSVRIGLFTTGRLGFYAGYLWFKEHHTPNIEYDDEGSLLLAGVDLRVLTTGSVEWYAKLGIAREEFKSTYPNRTESETSFKPDFGLLLNVSHFNTYLGWQPSDPFHINIGVGITG